MQTISGVHYNFSLPEAPGRCCSRPQATATGGAFPDRGYFALIRNFRRHSWLLLLLLGASPAVCGTFVPTAATSSERWDGGTYFAPHGDVAAHGARSATRATRRRRWR